MALLLRHTECPACGHRHHFSLTTEDLVPGREYAYLCPETAKKATLRPASAAEAVQFPPQGAVSLTPATYESPPGLGSPGDKGGKPDPGVAATPPGLAAAAVPTAAANEPTAGPTRLQEVLPDVKNLAGKVGGLDNLSDIVETLKETKE